MAEKHVAAAISFSGNAPAPIQGTIHTIWDFIANSGQTTLRFALDGATPAVSLDGTTYGTPTVYTDWANNSFMVIEPIAGSSWQVKIARTASTTILVMQMGMDGGWDHVTKTFPVTVCRTGPAVQWLPSAPSAGNFLYLSTSDADGYTYLRIVWNDPARGEGSKFTNSLYVGGYIPVDTVEDTQPVCCLVGSINGSNITNCMGARNIANLSRSPVEVAHTTLDLTSAGHCCAVGVVNLATLNLSRAGRWINLPVVLATTGGVTLGYFGTNTMLSGSDVRSDGAVSTPAEYLIMNDILVRWVV